jgi:TRAP-type C4-dicarboxylate transport system substrate-binding protein
LTLSLRFLPLASALTLSALTSASYAEEITLRAISAFQPSTVFYEPFQRFADRVNENGAGIVQIDVIGGPDAMPPFEIGNALRNGVVDMANTTAVYHANLVPEGLAMTLTDLPMSELRTNGGYDLLDKIHQEKANIHWLGRLTENVPYHIYLSEEHDSIDFKGMKIRSVPIYQAFFKGLGINSMQTAPGEVYTALERGTIDGYAWPATGVFDLGWQEKTKTRIDPGFYQVETGVYFSAKTWEKLSPDQREFLEKQMLEIEAESERFVELAATDYARQAEEGIATLTLPEADVEAFITMSVEEGWKPVMAANPELGAQLREMFSK